MIDKILKYLSVKAVIVSPNWRINSATREQRAERITIEISKNGNDLDGDGCKTGCENDKKIINLVFFLNIDEHLFRKTWNMIKKEHSNR